MSDVCRRCKAPILWAKTERGNMMPLDAQPDHDGNITLVHQDGDRIAVVCAPAVIRKLREIGEREVFYRSHFARCPYAKEFRRR